MDKLFAIHKRNPDREAEVALFQSGLRAGLITIDELEALSSLDCKIARQLIPDPEMGRLGYLSDLYQLEKSINPAEFYRFMAAEGFTTYQAHFPTEFWGDVFQFVVDVIDCSLTYCESEDRELRRIEILERTEPLINKYYDNLDLRDFMKVFVTCILKPTAQRPIYVLTLFFDCIIPYGDAFDSWQEEFNQKCVFLKKYFQRNL